MTGPILGDLRPARKSARGIICFWSRASSHHVLIQLSCFILSIAHHNHHSPSKHVSQILHDASYPKGQRPTLQPYADADLPSTQVSCDGPSRLPEFAASLFLFKVQHLYPLPPRASNIERKTTSIVIPMHQHLFMKKRQLCGMHGTSYGIPLHFLAPANLLFSHCTKADLSD
jgi:hypothetical protein